MADKVITSTGDCSACCGGGCFLTMPTLIIDATSTPYANSTVAAAAIAANVAGCLAEGGLGTPPQMSYTAFTATFSAGVLAVNQTASSIGTVTGFGAAVTCRVFLTAAGGLTATYSVSSSNSGDTESEDYFIRLFADDQTTIIDQVDSIAPIAGTFTPMVPSDGYYWIEAAVTVGFNDSGTGSTAISFSASGDGMVPCAVRASYGGTPDYVICT